MKKDSLSANAYGEPNVAETRTRSRATKISFQCWIGGEQFKRGVDLWRRAAITAKQRAPMNRSRVIAEEVEGPRTREEKELFCPWVLKTTK